MLSYNTNDRKHHHAQLILKICLLIQLIISCCFIQNNNIGYMINAQSIGYQTNYNPFGFNPYTSPLYGYGLGMPYGSYGLNALKNPWLLQMGQMGGLGGFSSTGWPQSSSFASKLHAKSILKKLGYDPYNSYPSYASYAAASSPYSYNYGYGKHYGAAQVPNNPYKSAYGDYYSTSAYDGLTPSSSSFKASSVPLTTTTTTSQAAYYDQSPLINTLEPHQHHDGYVMDKHAIIKPLIKAGAILTTAAILGKKKLELVPPKLNPTGMILNGLEHLKSLR